MKPKNILLTFFAVIVSIAVLINSKTVFLATQTAIENCLTTVVPSLMMFMTVACFVSESACGDVLSRLLRTPVRILFNLPEACAKTVLLSMLGGYPCGAKLISEMLRKKEIDKQTAQKMLRFCVNASPSYVISAIGIGLFGSAKTGAVIWISHILTAVLIGIIFRGRSTHLPKTSTPLRLSPSESLVKAVRDSTASMLYISGFVVTFSVVIALLNETGITDAVIALVNPVTQNSNTSRAVLFLLLDVVTGSRSCTACPPITAVLLCAAAVSLGGMSIWAQIAFAFSELRIKLSETVLFRLIHAVLTAATTYIIMCITDQNIETAYIFATNRERTLNGSVTTVFFLMCCVCFMITADKNISQMLQRREG